MKRLLLLLLLVTGAAHADDFTDAKLIDVHHGYVGGFVAGAGPGIYVPMYGVVVLTVLTGDEAISGHTASPKDDLYIAKHLKVVAVGAPVAVRLTGRNKADLRMPDGQVIKLREVIVVKVEAP